MALERIARRRLKVLVVRANTRHQDVRVTDAKAIREVMADAGVTLGPGDNIPGVMSDSLDTDFESRLIEEVLARSPVGSRHVDVKSIGDVTHAYLRQTIQAFDPDWIHYMGHCFDDGLALKDGTLSPQAFAALLKPRPITGLVLNCCDGRDVMSEAVGPFVSVLVAGDGAQPDAWAPGFACRFWRYVFDGRSAEDSFHTANPLSSLFPITDKDGQRMLVQFRHGLTFKNK
eukprot:m.397297 g.397297  ORF g.397297 m.397297 type:complete len:230 (+) comp20105_c0_seq3:58-747(+)